MVQQLLLQFLKAYRVFDVDLLLSLYYISVFNFRETAFILGDFIENVVSAGTRYTSGSTTDNGISNANFLPTLAK